VIIVSWPSQAGERKTADAERRHNHQGKAATPTLVVLIICQTLWFYYDKTMSIEEELTWICL
jgi:hypothetical protein